MTAQGRANIEAVGCSKAELGQITADAGLTTGAIYHHYGGKFGPIRPIFWPASSSPYFARPSPNWPVQVTPRRPARKSAP
jgi:hypothetical protein